MVLDIFSISCYINQRVLNRWSKLLEQKVKIFSKVFIKKWWAYRVWPSSFIISLWCIKAYYYVRSKITSSRGHFFRKVWIFFKSENLKNAFLKKWWAYRVYIRQKKLGWLSPFIISLWCFKPENSEFAPSV